MIYFFLYGVLGWIIDTAWRSYEKKKYVNGSFLQIPFMPIYGFGAVLILTLNAWYPDIPTLVKFVFFGTLLALLECIGGFGVYKIFGRRLWRYKGGLMNIGGFTNFAHLLLWGALAMLLICIHPFFERTFGPLW